MMKMKTQPIYYVLILNKDFVKKGRSAYILMT